MAGKHKIGAGLALDGEKEFKNALSDINAGLKVNTTALQQVSAEYANNADSAEALTAKGRILQDQVYSQTEKIKVLEKALANSADKNGEASKKTMQWQADLNKARAELAQMNNALGDNKEALEKTEQATNSLGDKVRGLASAVGLDIPPAMQGMVDKLDGVSASSAALVGVLGGIVVGLGKLTLSTTESAREIDTLSQKMGMTTDEYQEWDYVMKQVGGSAADMQGDLSQLAEKALDAKNGSGEAAEMFKQLGVRVTESGGRLKSQERLFNETVTALQGMSNETQRNAIASALLSTTGENLVPVLNMTKDELNGVKQAAHDTGNVLDTESIDKFKELDEAMKNMSAKAEGVKNNFALALLPVLTDFFEVMGAIPTPVLQTTIVLAGVITTLVLAFKATKELTGTASALKDFFGGMSTQTLKTTAIVIGIVAAVLALVVALTYLTGKGKDFEQGMASIRSTTDSLRGSTSNSYQRVPAYARGTNNHPGGLAMVGEDGPEIVDLPRGSKVFPNGTGPLSAGTQIGTLNIYPNQEQWNQVMSWVTKSERAQQDQRAGRR